MKKLIEVKNIKKNYGKKEAVKGLSFNVNEDEILGLLGPNGSGKTTTIGMLLGLLKPTSGQIFINNLKLEQNRIEILSDKNLRSDAQEYLIDYFRTKVSDGNCETFMLGRK